MKKLLSVLTATVLSLSLCSGTVFAAAGSTSGQQWTDASIIGNIGTDTTTDLKNDFYTAVNKDWILNTEMRDSQRKVSGFSEINDTVRSQITDLIQNGNAETHEAQLVRQLYYDVADMDRRNAKGVEPARKYAEAVLAINSMDELNAYMTDYSNPYAVQLWSGSPDVDLQNSGRYVIYTEEGDFSLDDADEYKHMTTLGQRKKAAHEKEFVRFYGLLGMSEDEAKKRYADMLDFETMLASSAYGTSDQKQDDYNQRIYNPATFDELVAAAPAYPVADTLKIFADRGITDYISKNPGYLTKLNELYTEDHLEAIKDMCLYNLMSQMIGWLNEESLSIYDEACGSVYGEGYHSDPAEDAYDACSDSLDWAVGKMYAEYCVSPQTKADIENIISEVLAVYKTRLENSTWLTAETRSKAVEKLDAMKVRAVYPDDWSLYDYSGLNFTAEAEGGNLIEDFGAISRFRFEQKIEDALKPVNPDKWILVPQTVNAGYSLNDNSINIPAGILGGDFYSQDRSEAANLGAIGIGSDTRSHMPLIHSEVSLIKTETWQTGGRMQTVPRLQTVLKK